ncbi:MAG: hypothetical protein DRP75_04750 [Candidatus Omnitrophota bacterium]|nr:MAG: hypothetical protein DRP75_04750 [Candidatus Omnitrophota bacterium]RLC40440.1 MAG: hypothetical protein DRH51_05580 [Candidatus Coatesbacteria bacterium]
MEGKINKIKELKAEIFDLLREQAKLQRLFNSIEKVKKKKIEELKQLEDENPGSKKDNPDAV